MIRKGLTTDLAKSAGLSEDFFPENHEEADIAEAVLTRELEELSLDEHEKIVFDVHGIARVPEETEAHIQSKLAELDKEINKIERKLAYGRAVHLCQSYVEDPNFRLMFLRCEMFDARNAAETFVNHFERKAELFGPSGILARDIHQTDLTPVARKVLESGGFQLVNTRDASGRAVVCIFPKLTDVARAQEGESLCQAWWYFCMAVLRDEETQRKGIVLVIYSYTDYQEDHDFMRRLQEVESCIPFRTAGHHLCYNDTAQRPFLTGVRLSLPDYERARVRVHFGEPEVVNFELQTFGIPTNDCPVKADGTCSTANHAEWLRLEGLREERGQGTQANVAVIPRRFDVLFGKSKQAKQHTGNLRLFHLCTMHWVEYEAANKYRKAEISDRLAWIIRQSNGRFLKWNDKEGWQEVDEATARAKISHFFRHIRSKQAVGTNTAGTTTVTDHNSTGERRKRPAEHAHVESSIQLDLM